MIGVVSFHSPFQRHDQIYVAPPCHPSLRKKDGERQLLTGAQINFFPGVRDQPAPAGGLLIGDATRADSVSSEEAKEDDLQIKAPPERVMKIWHQMRWTTGSPRKALSPPRGLQRNRPFDSHGSRRGLKILRSDESELWHQLLSYSLPIYFLPSTTAISSSVSPSRRYTI